MMFLSKEATEKDRTLKTQMILTTENQNEKVSNEAIWRKNGYFSDEKSDFNISDKDFPEDCLIYTNQGYISTVKGGELATYIQKTLFWSNWLLLRILPKR